MSLYNRTELEPFTRANADDVNNETSKIKAAIDQLYDMVNSLQGGGTGGTGVARYVWLAYADSADGTVNFAHDPGNRSYIGIAANKLDETASDFPEDYSWSLIRGSDAPTLRVVASAQRFDFDSDGHATAASEILFTAEATNIVTAIAFAAINDSGNAVTLTTVNDEQVKLAATDFGDADWVRVTATANGGGVSDSITITAKRETREVNHRGHYRNSETYNKNDIVNYRGSSFIARRDGLTGIAPTDGDEDDANWGLLARHGDIGDPATADSAFTSTINLTTSASGANLRRLARQAGYRGKSNATITFNVPNGVVITGKDDGGIAIDTGDWPTDLYTIALTLVVQSGGVVRGGGGNGGRGRGTGMAGQAGGDGGDAIFCRVPMTVTVDAGGTVSGGGGGGSGADSSVTGWPLPTYSSAGGGGGGFPNGNGGLGGGSGTDGLDGTVAGGGIGGTPGGYDGGGAGAAAPVKGGAGGYAIRKNGNTVTTTLNGTVQGTVG